MIVASVIVEADDVLSRVAAAAPRRRRPGYRQMYGDVSTRGSAGDGEETTVVVAVVVAVAVAVADAILPGSVVDAPVPLHRVHIQYRYVVQYYPPGTGSLRIPSPQ